MSYHSISPHTDPEMVVFFQIYSPWQTLLAVASVVKADRVVFFHPCPLGEDPLPRQGVRRKLTLFLIRAMNRVARIEEIDREGLYRLGFYQNNFESNRYVEEVFEVFSKSASFKAIQSLVKDPAVGRFFKMRLLDHVRGRTAFARAIPQVLGRSLAGTAVPANHDPYQLNRHFIPSADYARIVPFLVRTNHWLQDKLARLLGMLTLWNLLWLVIVPVAYLAMRVLRRGLVLRSTPIQADVVMPLIWGFAEGGLVRGLKRPDNSYLIGKNLGYERLGFYFSDWAFSTEEEAAQRQFMDRQGVRYFDPRTFVPSVGYLRKAGMFCLRLWLGLVRHPRILGDDPCFVKIIAALPYHYLRELLFVENVDYKVSLEYQDYLSSHVLRTIIANEHGRLAVGIHHNSPGGPYMFPSIRYTHINRYCVWGEEFLRLHAPFWDRLNTCSIGAPAVDHIVAAQQSERLRELEAFYSERYGGQHPLVLIQFPGLSTLNIKSCTIALIQGLARLKELPFEFQVVCRFRQAEHVQVFRELGLQQVMDGDSRIAVDMTELTTYEWVALSDVVIANSHSAGMIEATAAGKRCFSFDHLMLAEIAYGRYGSDLILRTADDLVRVFLHIRDNFRGWDCRWDQLAKAHCYFADGKNLDRYRQVILGAVAEVEERRVMDKSWEGESA